MTQYALPVIDPEVTTGTDLANYLNSWKPALLSSHAGVARPAYAVAGGLWVEQVSASLWNLKLFTGTLDAVVGSLNPTTGVFAIGGAGAFTTLTTSGNVTLGDAPADTLTVNATSTFAAAVNMTGGDLVVSRSSAGGTVLAQIWNTNNANAASHAVLRATAGGASGGDASVELQVAGAITWTLGVDNSDADKFKIGPAGVGTSTLLTLDQATSTGTVAGNFSAEIATPGGSLFLIGRNTDNTNAASHAVLQARVGGASSGDPSFRLTVDTGATWSVGVDNSDSDIFKVGPSGAVGTSTAFQIPVTGAASFNRPLYVNGDGVIQALQILDTANPSGAQIAFFGNGATTPNKYVRVTNGAFEIVRHDYAQIIMSLNDAGALSVGSVTPSTGFTSNGSINMPVTSGIRSRSAFSAWVRHDAAGNIVRAFNVSSVTKNATGNYTANIAAGVMADGSYGIVGMPYGGGTVLFIFGDNATLPSASSFRYQLCDHNGVPQDPSSCTVGILP